MCLYLKKSEYKKGVRIAKKDFYTVKFGVKSVLNRYFISPFQSTRYLLGKLYKSALNCNGKLVEEGIHSLTGNFPKSEWIEHLGCQGYIIALCKIPKGAKYYLGDDYDIVSDKIIPVEIIADGEDNSNLVKNSKQINCHLLTEMAKYAKQYIISTGLEIKPQ